MALSQKAVEEINQSGNFRAFEPTWQFERFMTMPFKIIGLFCGNQAFKTSGSMYSYVVRVYGTHPVPKKNVMYLECSERNVKDLSPHGYYTKVYDGVPMPGWEKGTWNRETVPKDGKCTFCGAPIVVHQRRSKKIRLCAETLPGDKESASKDGTQSVETKNTVYPELKRWMPPNLIKRDITFRNPAMIVLDPLKGYSLNGTVNKGEDIVFDFMGYSQTVQAGAGIQRLSIYCDEEPPKDFWDEQLSRLLAEDGDIILGLTPAQGMSWTFDELFERAHQYYRTPAVCDFLNKNERDRSYKRIEVTDTDSAVGVIQAATDDNPTLSPQVIEELFGNVDDPDVMATRRYGIHRQVSGRIFKSFDYRVHYIDFDEYFPDGMFRDYNHYRMIDYHPHNKWACVWLSISPQNEAFVWHEFSPDPEKMITRTIANEIALLSGQFKFKVNLIDPLAEQVQTNTGTTTVEDINDAFRDLKREGICTGGFWETWDTKGTRGREVVRERLNYAAQCRRPFNNKVKKDGTVVYLPTLWINRQCIETGRSLKQWRLESWARSYANVDRDRKESPAQKWSHFCTAIEAIMKDKRLKPALDRPAREPRPAPRYFQSRRVAL